MLLGIKPMAEQEQTGGMDFNMNEQQPFDNAQGKEAGWEIRIPALFLNPFFWIAALAIVALIGYNLWFSPSKNTQVSQTTTQTTQASPQAQAKTLGYFKKVSNTPVTLENKPYFLYVGAQFCPFCAAERWSIVKALSNFGTWSGLGSDTSADEEAGFSRIPTYNFVNAKYDSQYISYAHKETADRNSKPIPGQELTDFEKKWFNQYDPKGGVPFLFMNGQYVQLSSGYSPGLLSGKTYDQVKADVDSNNANVAYVAAINKEADIITAYLCKATGNKPENVCNDPKIAGLVAQVP